MLSEKIHIELKKLNFNLIKQNSFKRKFLLSMVQGVGSAIGATIIAGIVIAVLYRFITSINTLPLIQKLFPQTTFQQLFSLSLKK